MILTEKQILDTLNAIPQCHKGEPFCDICKNAMTLSNSQRVPKTSKADIAYSSFKASEAVSVFLPNFLTLACLSAFILSRKASAFKMQRGVFLHDLLPLVIKAHGFRRRVEHNWVWACFNSLSYHL